MGVCLVQLVVCGSGGGWGCPMGRTRLSVANVIETSERIRNAVTLLPFGRILTNSVAPAEYRRNLPVPVEATFACLRPPRSLADFAERRAPGRFAGRAADRQESFWMFADPLLSDPAQVLRRVFGFPGFRGQQEAAVNHVVAGGDALVLMPTGGGKSLCYQVPALCRARHRGDRLAADRADGRPGRGAAPGRRRRRRAAFRTRSGRSAQRHARPDRGATGPAVRVARAAAGQRHARSAVAAADSR